MAPKPLKDLRQHVEQTQSQYSDPAERDRALAVIEKELTGMLGTVRTYRNDAQLQIQGGNAERDGDAAAKEDGEAQTPPSDAR